MKNLIRTLIVFFITSGVLYSQQDSTKVVYPVGTASDTINIQAILAYENQDLKVEDYYIVTNYFLFSKDSKKGPEPYKQQVFNSNWVVINDFRERKVWMMVKRK